MRTISVFIISFILIPGIFAKDKYKLNPYMDVIHYEFAISLNDSSDIIRGETAITIDFKGLLDTFEFDLKNINREGKGMNVISVTFNGKPIKWTHKDDKVIITAESPAEPGSAGVIIISYSGIPADGLIISKNKFGDRTFFADHWPDRASNYLPSVDHPSDKATVDFIITSPSHYEVVATGHLVEVRDLPDATRLTHWKEDVPVPVKGMTFGAASFAVQLSGTVYGTPVWTWVFSQNSKEGFYDYSFALKPLAFFCELIGPYPYEKLANVQSKTIFGGLENAGCIFYFEESVTGRGEDERLLTHEISHQWFGNSVTEKEWNHIWLSEGFASYLTSVYMEKMYGKDKFNELLISDRKEILRSFNRKTGPVIDTTITNLMDLLNVNSYKKGEWFLHMLRQKLGDEIFWKGIRLFYLRYRDKTALSGDLLKILEEVSDSDLKNFFYQWLYIPGQPDLKIKRRKGKTKGTIDITVKQTQNYLFSFNIDFSVKDSRGTRIENVSVKDRETIFNIQADEDAEIKSDPDIKLLFRNIRKRNNII